MDDPVRIEHEPLRGEVGHPPAEPLGAVDQISLVGGHADPVLVDTHDLGWIGVGSDEQQPGDTRAGEVGPQRFVARPLHQFHMNAGKIGGEGLRIGHHGDNTRA